MLKGWAVVCGLWLWGATSALAQERDDEDTPDDLEWGEYTDDGEPIEDAPPLEVCNRQPSVDITLEWNLGSDAEFTLPPAGDGSTWTIEYRARGRDVDLAWEETSQGSPTMDVTHSLVLPPNVVDAAALTPLALTARAVAKDATDTVVGTRFTDSLILDARSGSMQYERWEDHVWPTITNAEGEIVTIADLDWDPATSILTPGDGNSVDTGDTGFALVDTGTFFPEDLAPDASVALATISVTFCVELKVNFFIAPDSAGGRQSYFGSNSDKHARGHWVFATGPATSKMYDFATWRSNGGSLPGCATLSLQPGRAYDIWVGTAMSINGQYAAVRKSQSTGRWQGRVLLGFIAPYQNTVVFAKTAHWHPAWNVSSVLAWGMYRRKVPGFNQVSVYIQQACSDGGSCAKGDEAFIVSSDRRQQFTIAHEIGHVVGYVTDDRRAPNFDYSLAALGNCYSSSDGHRLPGKEYASAAAVEGFANYWAAVVFNNTNQSDCAVEAATEDFNWDGILDGLKLGWEPFNCEGEAYWGDASYSEQPADHLGYVCNGVKANRGSEYDWMRMFWDLDDGLSFSTILEVWDRANPKNWRKDDTGLNGKPWRRIIDAADQVSSSVRTKCVNDGQWNGTSRL